MLIVVCYSDHHENQAVIQLENGTYITEKAFQKHNITVMQLQFVLLPCRMVS